MTCREFVELVTDHLEGALDDVTRLRYDDHRALCAGCDTYVRQVQETTLRLREVPVATLSVSSQRELLAAFRELHR